MRISPAGWAFDTLEDVLDKARQYTQITHNHPEGIKGAQATAAAIFLARTGKSKEEVTAIRWLALPALFPKHFMPACPDLSLKRYGRSLIET